jgi:hypothetical protein
MIARALERAATSGCSLCVEMASDPITSDEANQDPATTSLEFQMSKPGPRLERTGGDQNNKYCM